MKTASAEAKIASSRSASLQTAINCAGIAAENKARDVVVMDLTGVTPLYDYFVIATGSSRRQIHNLAEEIDAAMASSEAKAARHRRLRGRQMGGPRLWRHRGARFR